MALFSRPAPRVALTCAMFLIRDDPRSVGRLVLPRAAASSDLSSSPAANAAAPTVHTQHGGLRLAGVAGAGSAALLLVIYLGFMSGSGSQRAWLAATRRERTQRANGDAGCMAPGWRCWARHCCWSRTDYPIPVRRLTDRPAGYYRKLWTEISAEWRRDRQTLFALPVASARYSRRAGGHFAFGAVLGVTHTLPRLMS